MFIMCVLFEYNNEYELTLRIRCRIRMGISKKCCCLSLKKSAKL